MTAASDRLKKGELRGMVEDFLTEHPGEQFGPNTIGKALHRSPGAGAQRLGEARG
ncbi:hypothetical protein [Saccharopolyspora phatthalungensis]|uniref:Uncharacterized protein n=1 Tax=Saccharopolyspora phatthalungensis TaxID=664693 RepID=A0A840QBV9_9PSEU|nr:hypothetical protein [Saccharopolyspora phatthalungensis]MBB5157437.1 hypothetical protein [Saccharopolyspora phatthalungensis]